MPSTDTSTIHLDRPAGAAFIKHSVTYPHTGERITQALGPMQVSTSSEASHLALFAETAKAGMSISESVARTILWIPRHLQSVTAAFLIDLQHLGPSDSFLDPQSIARYIAPWQASNARVAISYRLRKRQEDIIHGALFPPSGPRMMWDLVSRENSNDEPDEQQR